MGNTVTLLLDGFITCMQPVNLMAMAIGAVLGLLVGALPGIGALTGCALLLPLTYSFNPTTAIIMLAAIYYSNMYGGSYSAILLNIPGDNSCVMTTLDGYPMAKKGQAGKALFTANFSSFVGGTIGMIILTAVGPALAKLGLRFGPAEMTSLLIVAMSSLGWMVGEKPLKGLISACVGMMIATIGSDPTNGAGRFYFGNYYLLSGITFVPLVIGIFGFSQLIGLMKERFETHQLVQEKPLTLKESMLSRDEFKKITGPTLRGSFLGTIVGIIPGAGGSVANFMSYMMEKRIGKRKELLGTGIPEGVAASESANNAAVAGAMAPLLSLGIPGSGTTAVLLGGLIMWGLTPGPLLFSQQSEFCYGLIASLYVANIFTLIIGLLIIPVLSNISRISSRVLIPVICVICFVGAYSSTNSLYGVMIMLVSGVFGYIFNRCGYPSAPMLLAFVLSSMLETNMRKAFTISFGSPMIFLTKPISLVLLLFMAVSLVIPAVNAVRLKKK